MSSYFDVLSWTRARKNREALEKTNPQNPVLNDDDEQFLEKITSQETPAPPLPTVEPTVIDDEGVESEATATQKEAAEMILPSSPGEKGGKEAGEKRSWASYIPSVPVPSVPSLASLRAGRGGVKDEVKEKSAEENSGSTADKADEPADNEPSSANGSIQKAKDSTPEETEEKAEATKEIIQDTKDALSEETKESEIPVDQDVDVTRETISDTKKELSEDTEDSSAQQTAEDAPKEVAKDDAEPEIESKAEDKELESKPDEDEVKDQVTEEKEPDKTDEPTQRTWASYIPAMPSLGRKGKEPEDIAAKVQTPESKEQDEREVSVLLDRLNLSAINNRVFSFSDQSQKLYGEFTLILKDMVNGAPTAYEDLETLLKDNEKHLEQMFKNMPPFVQTLVKSLPSKFATSMGPEIMAMAGDKPGNDMRQRMEAATKASSSVSAASMPNLDVKRKQKKRNVPGVKDLASEKGAVTSMLTNIVNFLKVRFPAFVTGTNVVMSLAVFSKLFFYPYIPPLFGNPADQKLQSYSLSFGTATSAARKCACCARRNRQRHQQPSPKSLIPKKKKTLLPRNRKQRTKERQSRNPLSTQTPITRPVLKRYTSEALTMLPPPAPKRSWSRIRPRSSSPRRAGLKDLKRWNGSLFFAND